MSPLFVVRVVLLATTAVLSGISGWAVVVSINEGDPYSAWAGAALFIISALVGAWTFAGLVML